MKSNSKPEIRSFRASELRVASEGDGNILTGYIAVTNTPTEMFPGYIESLARGCFKRTLSAGDDVVALINHDSDAPVGRISAGTLSLSEDDSGLKFALDLPNTTRANDLKISVERKDVTGCSFGFIAYADDYVEDKNGVITRTIKDLELLEVSVGVTFPAYPQTSMSLRSLPDSIPVEFRSRLEQGDAKPEPEPLPEVPVDDWRLNTDLLLRLADAQ